MAAHDDMLSRCELDLFGDPFNTKRKVDMMVQLVTLTCSEADTARLDVSNEREHILQRNLACSKGIDVQGIFDDKTTVLVRGLPGCGKSTFCYYILMEWKSGRLWKEEYEFVFYINAPLLLSSLGERLFKVEDILKAAYPAVFRNFLYTELIGYPHIVMIDSIDECDIDAICKKSSSSEEAFRQLIQSPETFKRIILGRPHACDQVRRTLLTDGAFQFVEIVGFSSDRLEEYVHKFYATDKAYNVMKKMRENASLYNLAHIPVFANIICNIYSEDSAISIESITEIYVYAYVVFLTRHLKGKPEYCIDVSTFENLFTNERLITALANVSRMAFENVMTGKIFFEATDFHFMDIDLTLVSSFIAKRKRFLCFSHVTLMEFFAAVHMFINRLKLHVELLGNQHMRGVLPLFFGLLGGAVKISTSAKIICSFVKPLMKMFRIQPLKKHPLCDAFYESVYGMDANHDLYVNLIFEFRNAHLLHDSSVYWENDAMLSVHRHQQFERVVYLMKNFLTCEGREIECLVIDPIDKEISLSELGQLNDCLSLVGSKVRWLHLNNFTLDGDLIACCARLCFFVRRLVLQFIQAMDGEGWEIFLRHLEDAKQKDQLRIEWLVMSDCQVFDTTIKEQLKRIVRQVHILC